MVWPALVLSSGPQDPLHFATRERARPSLRSRRSIKEPWRSLGLETSNPPVHGGPRHACSLCSRFDAPALLEHALHKQPATARQEPRIRVGHESLLLGSG